MKLNLNKLKLYKDNYNIYNLITKIDCGYRLFFCNENHTYYIINIANHNEICMKFKSFNSNILKNLQMSRIENSHKLFNEIDENNLLVKKNLMKKHKNNFANALAEINMLGKRVGETSSSKINKIIEESNA